MAQAGRKMRNKSELYRDRPSDKTYSVCLEIRGYRLSNRSIASNGGTNKNRSSTRIGKRLGRWVLLEAKSHTRALKFHDALVIPLRLTILIDIQTCPCKQY